MQKHDMQGQVSGVGAAQSQKGKKVSSMQMMRRCRYKVGVNTKVDGTALGEQL